MPIGFIDYETRSSGNLKTEGTDKYFSYADARATICTYAVDDGPVRIWDMMYDEREPSWHEDAFADERITLVALNAPFDRRAAVKVGKPSSPRRWICARVQGNSHGLPGGLDGLCAALGVPANLSKLKDGQRLIQLFCVPKKGRFIEPWEAPGEWEEFKQYAVQDSVALREVYRRLPKHNLQGFNLDYHWLDAEINERGFAIDLPLIEEVVVLLESAKSQSDDEVAGITDGAVTAITQRDKLLKYLTEKGLTLPNMRKSELENALQRDDLSPEQRLLIESRLEGARASGSKYKRATIMHVGGRLRYTQQMSGAGRTGRTAHKGFQPGNMPRAVTYNGLAKTLAEQHVPMKADFIDNVVLPAIRAHQVLEPWAFVVMGRANTVAANSLRHMIVAEEGNELTVADYKNIESVVLSWVAGEEWKLLGYREAFASPKDKSKDMYRKLGAGMFGWEAALINDHQRNACKVVELACGFGGSVGAFVTMSVGYGMDLSALPELVLPHADAKLVAKAETAWWRAFLGCEDYSLEPNVYMAIHVLVQMYRSSNSKIDGLKKSLGRAVTGAVKRPGTLFEVGRCRIWATRGLLIVELPSGYRLNYWAPEVGTETVIDPETGEPEERSFLSFKRARGSRMVRERSWPGLTLENIVQAIANQLLRRGKLEVNKVYPKSLVLAVHDEAVSEAKRGLITLDGFCAELCKGWDWSRGLPLAADGWQGPRYGKR